jgi:hypothetical protein
MTLQLRVLGLVQGWHQNNRSLQNFKWRKNMDVYELCYESEGVTAVSRTSTLSWSVIVLAHNPRVDMSLHTDIVSWFRANQYLYLHLNDVCFAKKEEILPMLLCLVWHDWGLYMYNIWSINLTEYTVHQT